MQCSAVTGEGLAAVDVEYEFEYDGAIVITSVEFESVNIIPCLTEDQLTDIEAQCEKAQQKLAKEAKEDLGEALYNERMAA